MINQLGLATDSTDSKSLNLLLNYFVQTIDKRDDKYVLTVKDTLNDRLRDFKANIVVLAAGSLESSKILHRSPLFGSLDDNVKSLVGRGLTDHPTTNDVRADITHIGNLAIPKDTHGKIIFYSRGKRDVDNSILYPFNVEMNINHEYWHLRENDPSSPGQSIDNGEESKLDIKFSFGNCLDDENLLNLAGDSVVPKIQFKNLNWMDDLAANRFRLLAGWNKSYDDIFWVLNGITNQIFSQFRFYSEEAKPDGWYGQGKSFGYGTVHHAVGTLRMPTKSSYDAPSFSNDSVVDDNLMVVGHNNLFVCDMSVMPLSSAANPVRTLAGLALRLSNHIRGRV